MVVKKIEATPLSGFSRRVEMLFFRVNEFEEMDPKRIREELKGMITKSVRYDHVLKYDSGVLTVTDTSGKLVRVIFPAKISNIEKAVQDGTKLIILTYQRIERIVILT